MDATLCQRMLCDHGIFPSEVAKRPLKEKLLMHALYAKEDKEVKERMRKK